MKPPNKAGRPVAEAVERRAEAKENANRYLHVPDTGDAIPHPIRSLCTLRTRRRRRLRNTRFPAARYRLTGAGLSPAGSRQLRLTHQNQSQVQMGKDRRVSSLGRARGHRPRLGCIPADKRTQDRLARLQCLGARRSGPNGPDGARCESRCQWSRRPYRISSALRPTASAMGAF